MASVSKQERAFDFIHMNERQEKPRTRGLTEIRGPYYTVMGKRYLEDILETMGQYVDSLKFAAGSFSLMPKTVLREIIELAHKYDVKVSTGGFIEYVLTQGPDAVDKYIKECGNVGLDILEISSGFITILTDDWLRLVEKVKKAGLKPKPEVGTSSAQQAQRTRKSSKQRAPGTRAGPFSRQRNSLIPVLISS
jgi:phosphosulfolactate synthase (CoM biosynthesis protein A)